MDKKEKIGKKEPTPFSENGKKEPTPFSVFEDIMRKKASTGGVSDGEK